MSSEKPEGLRGLKILVIDDSKTIRRTAETLLTKEGCEVYTAVDGFDSLSKIADHQPDLIFVDIMMPRLDCRFRALPDKAVHQGRVDRRNQRAIRQLSAPAGLIETWHTY